MQIYDEQTAVSEIEALAQQVGLRVVTSNVERSELLETMPIVNLFVAMANPDTTHASMLALEKLINKTWGGACRIGLYFAEIGYDEVPEGQGLIQIDLLEFELEPTQKVAPSGPKP